MPYKITNSNLPSESDSHMSPNQLDYFRGKLLALKSEFEESSRNRQLKLNDADTNPIEEVERSAIAIDRDIEIRNQARNRNMIQKINHALDLIEKGGYGYCQESDEPIGIKRLEADPTALFCLDVQESYERGKRPVSNFD